MQTYCYNITLDIRSTSGKCIFVYYLNTRKTTVCIISYINVLFCDTCQRTNNPIKKKRPPLNSVAVPDTPWRQVGLDLIGPLPEADSGYKYAATMTDYFSKQVSHFEI
jgi:hypothetical protein